MTDVATTMRTRPDIAGVPFFSGDIDQCKKKRRPSSRFAAFVSPFQLKPGSLTCFGARRRIAPRIGECTPWVMATSIVRELQRIDLALQICEPVLQFSRHGEQQHHYCKKKNSQKDMAAGHYHDRIECE
jgi:hypothetical protein